MGIQGSVRRPVLMSVFMLAVLSSLPAPVWAQFDVLGAGGAGGVGSGSRFPLRVKLSGTLNPTTPKENSIKVAVLSISGYRETYQFEIMHAEAVDDKQTMRATIVPSIRSENYDFLVVGTKELLSRIGQSVPNTPITIIGFLRQRKRELILETVETISVGDLPPDPSPHTAVPSSPPSSDAIPSP